MSRAVRRSSASCGIQHPWLLDQAPNLSRTTRGPVQTQGFGHYVFQFQYLSHNLEHLQRLQLVNGTLHETSDGGGKRT